MKRKKINPHKFLAVFAITTLIFIIGVIIGNHLNSIKIDRLTLTENQIRSSTLGMELEYLIRSENPCAAINSSRFAAELGDISKKLTFMESQLGKEDVRVINLKEYYSILEIRHWLFFKRARDECNADYSLVLYFYSNLDDCDDCESQGNILTYVHKKNPRFNIYSFDINIENPALEAIKEIYNVKAAPTLIIDGKTYPGFMSKDKLVELLIK